MGSLLPFMVKVKQDSYCETDRNGKIEFSLWDEGSIKLQADYKMFNLLSSVAYPHAISEYIFY